MEMMVRVAVLPRDDGLSGCKCTGAECVIEVNVLLPYVFDALYDEARFDSVTLPLAQRLAQTFKFVLLCFIKLILGNRYGPGASL